MTVDEVLHQTETFRVVNDLDLEELFASLYAELRSVDEQITAMEQRIQRAFQRDEACQKIADVGRRRPSDSERHRRGYRGWQGISQWAAAGGLAGTGGAIREKLTSEQKAGSSDREQIFTEIGLLSTGPAEEFLAASL